MRRAGWNARHRGTARAGPEGTDRLTGIEVVRFLDQDIVLA
ncbi:hypothetical protein [Paracraurococcus ruber]|nr:hypothetical protein [Paracraurococcus ruber]